MASPESLKSFARLRAQGAAMPTVVPKLPPIPDDVKKRFPEMKQYEEALEKWRTDMSVALGWVNPQ